MPDGETFDFGELAKKSHPKATRRFGSDKTDEMRRNQIVAVELFLDRTILFREIDGRPDGGDQHQIVGIAREPDRNRARVGVVQRWESSAMHLQNSLLRDSMPAYSPEYASKAARNSKDRAGNSGSAQSRSRSANRGLPASRVGRNNRRRQAAIC